MKATEAAALLTICAAYDNRKPDPDAAKAWALALDDLRFEDCREAVIAHYRISRDWVMPVDVRVAVKRLRSARLMEAPILTPPAGLDPDNPDEYTRWLNATRKAIADGVPVEQASYEATRAIGELRAVVKTLPPIPVKPNAKTAEHQARKEAARAELDARREVPVPTTEPTEGEPT